MAEIEKGLPNEPELKVEDINTNETVEKFQTNQVSEKTDIEVTQTPDGGAEISFDPKRRCRRINITLSESSRSFR